MWNDFKDVLLTTKRVSTSWIVRELDSIRCHFLQCLRIVFRTWDINDTFSTRTHSSVVSPDRGVRQTAAIIGEKQLATKKGKEKRKGRRVPVAEEKSIHCTRKNDFLEIFLTNPRIVHMFVWQMTELFIGSCEIAGSAWNLYLPCLAPCLRRSR